MPHKANHYATNYNPAANRSQGSRAINEMGSLMGSMALGPDPSDDALFRNRLLQGKGYQLSNRGTEATLNARDLMATNPDFIKQIIGSLGLDPTKVDSGRMGDFGTYAAQTKDPHLIAQSLSTLGRGSASTAKEVEALAQSKLMNPVLLEHANTLVQNLGLVGDKTNQQIYNLEDLQTNLDAESAAGIAQTEAGTREIDQRTAALLAGMGLKKGESEADVGLVKEQTEQVEKLTEPKVGLLKSQAKVPEAQAAAITAESEETQKLLQAKVTVQNATRWLQASKGAAARSGIRNKNAESAERVSLLQAQTGVFGQQSNAIIAAIANKNYESALRGIKTAVEALVTKQLGDAKREEIGEQMKVLRQQVLDLQAEQGNKKNESEARVKVTDFKGDLVEEQITTETTLRPRQAELLDAKTNYWNQRGEGEMAKALGLTTGTGGKKTGTSQFDYRKTKTAFEMNYNIEDVGKKYIVQEAKEGTFRFGWGEDEVLEETTYLWPDDDKAVRAILTPTLQQGAAAQKAAMAKARAKLSEFGKDKPKEIHAIIKSIMQVPPSK